MKKVLLIFGGNSKENLISRKSARSIIENIDYTLFDLESVYISLYNNWYYFNDFKNILNDSWLNDDLKIHNIIEYIKKFDIVFPIVHGTNGEDGKLQGMLELFNIPFVGCNTTTSAIGMDKGFSKLVFDALNIKQTNFEIIDYNNYNYLKIIKNLAFPMIVKPANGGSSIGINKAKNHIELKKAIDIASKYDSRIVIEEFIRARELECAILKDKKITVSDIGEIISSNDFYDYDAKYVNNSNLIIPTKISKKIKKEIQRISKEIFTKLDCKVLSRIDFLYDEDRNIIYLNEINTLPGFTEISMYPKLLTSKNITYKDLITKIIKSSL